MRSDDAMQRRLDRVTRAVARMAPGSLGGRVASAAPESRPRAIVERRSASVGSCSSIQLQCSGQTTSTGVLTTVTGWFEAQPTCGAALSLSADTTSIVANEDGDYLVLAAADWISNATGYRWIEINHTECANSVYPTDVRGAVSGAGIRQSCSGIIRLSAGESCSVRVLQNSGGSLDVGATGKTFFQAAKLCGCGGCPVL